AQRVTVRRRPNDRCEPDVAGGSRPVLDDERATELLGEPFGNQASVDVVRAAGRKTNDEAHRPRRIGVCPRDPRDGGECGGARCEMEKISAGEVYGLPLRNAAALHSSVIPAARTPSPRLSASSAMSFPTAADVIDIGSTPKPASRALMWASAVTALISVLSLSITSAGVSFGAPTPYHWFAS